jgi:hypothetical protein
MAPATRPLFGRNPRGGGRMQQAQTGRRAAGVPPAVIPLPQTPPRAVSNTPRFRPPQVAPVPRPYTAPGMSGAGTWRGGDNTNDALIFRDRAPHLTMGYEIAGRISSQPDPPSDGPVRPSVRLVNRTWNWQVGTGQAYTDDLSRPYTHLGEQGSGWTTIYGGAPGFYRMGPGGQPVGDPNAGPGRVWAGPAHGLHTMYPPDRAQTLTNYRARPQMVAPRVDRLSNSRIAGQNYSQWTRHQGGGRQ